MQALHGGWCNVLVGEDTVLQMLFEDHNTGAFEARTGSDELGKNVVAGTTVFEHATERANLSFNAGEPVEEAFIDDGWKLLLRH